MSRLAVYPLAGSFVFFFGRKNISATHLITGAAIGLLPAISLLWGTSAIAGIPFAVRWLSFGMMIVGFSGTIARWGFKSHLTGLVAAAAATSVVILIAGADSVTGNANRAGMVLALGFMGNLVLFNKIRWYSWVTAALIICGIFVSSFYIAWIACFAGTLVFFFSGKLRIHPWMVLVLMIAGQILFSLFPGSGGNIGPTLELRSRIWRCSSSLFVENLPLGTGIGSARLMIFNSAEPELRELAGGDKRIDFLHSEPLTMITEMGIPGLLLLLFILYWLSRKCKSSEQLAFLTAFWPIFTSDLPLATPLGAIPAALFLGFVPSLNNQRLRIPVAIPVLALIISLYWCFTVVSGYSALGNTGRSTVSDLELAGRRIPWEERVFLVSGQAHLQSGMVLSALEDSRKFLSLYPDYYKGWELRALALSAAGRSSFSAWARAALLVPDNIYSPDRYLFALNAIQPAGMNPDTAVSISIVLTRSRENISEFTDNMNSSEMFFVSSKLIDLSEQCRPVSMNSAAETWFMATCFAIEGGSSIPPELAVRILRERDLYSSLKSDRHPKADEYLELLMDELGIELVQIPSP